MLKRNVDTLFFVVLDDRETPVKKSKKEKKKKKDKEAKQSDEEEMDTSAAAVRNIHHIVNKYNINWFWESCYVHRVTNVDKE